MDKSQQKKASGAMQKGGIKPVASQAVVNSKKRPRDEDTKPTPQDTQANKRRKILEAMLAETKSRDAAMEDAEANRDKNGSNSRKGFLYKSNFRSNDNNKKSNQGKPGNSAARPSPQKNAAMLSEDSDGEEKTFPRSQPTKQQRQAQQQKKNTPAASKPVQAPAAPQNSKSPVSKPQPKQADSDSDAEEAGADNLTGLQAKMKAKLEGGRFRFINEKLYTTVGNEAFSLFQKQPDLFDVYHEGYRNQVEKWPENPLDVFIKFLQGKPEKMIVADFGCGEARLAQSVKQKVHSFDLVARNEFITACDISHVPLKDATVDVAIFSLSLMGTNFMQFLKEAHRVLKIGGEVKIAEVKSRFEEYSTFIKAMRKMGFDLIHQDDSNKMFVLFDFLKTARKSEVVPVTLKPCKYKKR